MFCYVISSVKQHFTFYVHGACIKPHAHKKVFKDRKKYFLIKTCLIQTKL